MKMDQKLVASRQKHEVDYVAKKYNAPKDVVRNIQAKGRSRKQIYVELEKLGYKKIK